MLIQQFKHHLNKDEEVLHIEMFFIHLHEASNFLSSFAQLIVHFQL